MKRKLVKLSMIILGVLMAFSFNKVKANEITSIFTGETLNRTNIQMTTLQSSGASGAISKTLKLSKTSVTDENNDNNMVSPRKNGDFYQWDVSMAGNKVISGYNVWKIIEEDGNFDNLYYCLQADIGMGNHTGTISSNTYNFSYDMKKDYNTIKNLSSNLAISNQETYNKILWILDNTYIPTGDNNYQSSSEYKSLMNNAGVTIDSDSRLNLTENDIDSVQQLAIWYFTNSSNTAYNGTILPSLYINGRQLSSMYLFTNTYGTQITGRIRQEKTEKLYNYFITNATSSYEEKVPELELTKNNAKVLKNGTDYVVGPFKLEKENVDIKGLTVKLDNTEIIDYLIVSGVNSTTKITDYNNFYIRIPQSKITNDDANVSIEFKGEFSSKEISFMTNVSNVNDTQPVALVKPITTELKTNTNINIELTTVKVIKNWADDNDRDGIRPQSIKVQLYADETAYGEAVTLNAGNNWQYEWTELLNDKTYTVKELDTNNVAIQEGGKYKGKYTVNYSTSNNTTTITNTHIPLKIDLALRKYITSINGTEITSDNEDYRVPQIDTAKLKDGTETTAIYSHKKNAIEVEENDEIIYNITIYNEGEKEARASKIVDQLPSGLEFVEVAEGNYEKESYDTDTNRLILKEKDTNSNLAVFNKENGELDSTIVKVKCKVVASAGETEQILTNIAWISEMKDTNGVIESDRDSQTSSSPDCNKDNMSNYNRAEKENTGYYPGQQDDDDYDRIVIKPEIPVITGTYSVKLIKLDESGNTLNGSKFEVNEVEYDLTSTSEIILENNKAITSLENIELNYSIEEKVAPEGYQIIENAQEINIKAEVEEKDGNYVLKNAKLIDAEGKEKSNDIMSVSLGENNTIEIKVINKPIEKKFDLSLRKFITKVNDTTYSREPVVDTRTILTNGTATYKHTKQPIAVQKGDVVTYTIRVYNEGEIDGYVNKIVDYLPDNLIPIIEGVDGIDSEKYADEIAFNASWSWVNLKDEETGKLSLATQITAKDKSTDIPNIAEDKQADARLLNAAIKEDGTVKAELDYIDVQVKCLVSQNAVCSEYITNIAEIAHAEDIDGIERTHISNEKDSTVLNADISSIDSYKNEEALTSTDNSYIPGQEDDDDFEKLIVKEFDLALRKFITKVEDKSYSREPVVDASKLNTLDTNGKMITTAIYTHTKEPVIVETGNTVTYTIRVYNEGTLDGFAEEITDDIPEGLEFSPDNSFNIKYKWKMLDKDGNETNNAKEAVMIVTDYLSSADENNIIKAVQEVEGNKTLNYKDVEVQFKVIAVPEKLQDNVIKNVAQISDDSNDDRDSIPHRDEKYDYEISNNNEDDIDYEPIKLQYFDLALRKFITKVNTIDYNNRYPEIKYNEDGSISYEHSKDPVIVATKDTVIYTIRVYNEGDKAGTATEIIDNLPKGIEFLPDNEINKDNKWKMLDKDGNVTENIEDAVKVSTDILKNETIDGFISKSKVLSFKDVEIAFKVTQESNADRIIVNTAEIFKDNGDDIDSIPGNNVETEDDLDKEYLKVEYFDLALKKWVTETRVTYNGKTTTTKTGFTEDSEELAKVDLVAKQMSKTTVKFAYSIKVINEGEVPGYAYEVKDYVPSGLKFNQEDNPDWKQLEDGTVVTEKLKDTLLGPNESATVDIVLTWENSTTNLGLKTNYAEISKDSGDDVDSTPDNFNKEEDDIDDAQVILSIKTNGPVTYIGLTFLTISILAGGIILIKKYVM